MNDVLTSRRFGPHSGRQATGQRRGSTGRGDSHGHVPQRPPAARRAAGPAHAGPTLRPTSRTRRPATTCHVNTTRTIPRLLTPRERQAGRRPCETYKSAAWKTFLFLAFSYYLHFWRARHTFTC